MHVPAYMHWFCFIVLIDQLAQLSALFNHQALFSLMQKMVAVRTHFTLLLRFFEQIDVDSVILHNSFPYNMKSNFILDDDIV